MTGKKTFIILVPVFLLIIQVEKLLFCIDQTCYSEVYVINRMVQNSYTARDKS